MALWKYSLEVVSRELELVKKKKQALDNLFNTDKISQSTYDYINKDLTDAITETETHQKTLADKITARANELENQLKSLEVFLANLEMHYSAGEIDEEMYKHQGNAINLGIEATKQELMDIKDALSKFISEAETPPTPPAPNEAVYEEEEIEEPVEVIAEEPTEEMVEAPGTVGDEAPVGTVSEETSAYEETLAY